MQCEAWKASLDRYFDGELPPAEAAEVSKHLRSCGDCSREALEGVLLKRNVKLAGNRYAPSAELRRKVLATVKPRTSSRAPWWRWTPVFALVLLVVAGLVYMTVARESTRTQRVYSELADLHVATLASATPVDVLSSDRHTVKPWFQGRIPFTFSLPELQGTEFSLVGGRVAYLEQTSGAHLIYQVRQHKISVFIFPEREGFRIPPGAHNELSFNTERWTKDRLQYVVIGDASPADVHALSKLLQNAG